MSNLATKSPKAQSQAWERIARAAGEFWDRCTPVYDQHGNFLHRQLTHTALVWLQPILSNIVWYKITKPSQRFVNQNQILDFRYEFVGSQISNANGRGLHGEKIFDRLLEISGVHGSGGVQSELISQLYSAVGTGQNKALFTQFVNSKKKICDLHQLAMPVSYKSTKVTDIFCPTLISPIELG